MNIAFKKFKIKQRISKESKSKQADVHKKFTVYIYIYIYMNKMMLKLKNSKFAVLYGGEVETLL